MKKIARITNHGAKQLMFTYRRSVAERLASGELRDVSQAARAGGFRPTLAVSLRLWNDVETVPPAYRRTETPRGRWQHLFLLAAPAAKQVQRDGKLVVEINVVLRTTDAPERSREHVKTLLLQAEKTEKESAPVAFTLGYKGE